MKSNGKALIFPEFVVVPRSVVLLVGKLSYYYTNENQVTIWLVKK